MRVQTAFPKAALVDVVLEGVKAGLLGPASCPLQSGTRALEIKDAGGLEQIASTHSRASCVHLISVGASQSYC
jgi:hypothetical protein